MRVSDPDEIIKLHDQLIDEFGGAKGLISKDNLISSLSRPFYGLADGTELYPTLADIKEWIAKRIKVL